MTGLRASPMRRRVCVSPLAQWQSFNPVTSDYWEMINRWDDSRWDDDHVQDRGHDLDAVALLASGGFGVSKP